MNNENKMIIYQVFTRLFGNNNNHCVYNGDISFLPIDATFEVQLRTISFEGWHEIEHDMRYKSPYGDDFWREDLSRTLNSVLANLELCDWTTLNVFEKLADYLKDKGIERDPENDMGGRIGFIENGEKIQFASRINGYYGLFTRV